MPKKIISGLAEPARSTPKSARGPGRLTRVALGTLLSVLGLLGLGSTGCKSEKLGAVDMSMSSNDLDSTPRCEDTKCENPDAKCCNGEACVDITTSTQNCGSCGTVCRTRELCKNATCTCTGGGHSGQCGTSEQCCPDGCHQTMTDAKNCGGCGLSCKAAETCQTGKCSCGPSGIACRGSQSCCGTGCVDLQTDAKNCGTCGKVCATGHACVAGLCEGECLPCAAGETCCNGICANLLTDKNNCLACGKKCMNGPFPAECIVCWFRPLDGGMDGGAVDMSLPHD